jgi:hypothetical protein
MQIEARVNPAAGVMISLYPFLHRLLFVRNIDCPAQTHCHPHQVDV